jgi:hypothetical protein
MDVGSFSVGGAPSSQFNRLSSLIRIMPGQNHREGPWSTVISMILSRHDSVIRLRLGPRWVHPWFSIALRFAMTEGLQCWGSSFLPPVKRSQRKANFGEA